MVAAEIILGIGILAFVIALAVKGTSQKRVLALAGGILVIFSAAAGGLAFVGIEGIIDLEPKTPPKANSLFSASILYSSDTDRTEVGETVSTDGHTITYSMADAQMDGLGDVNLDVRVTNQNIGIVDDIWAFSAIITEMSTIGTPANPILNQTDSASRWDVSWTLTDAGSPTLSQSGDQASSNDWKTGLSDVLNIDMAVNPGAADDITSGQYIHVDFLVGGVTLSVVLLEQ